MEELIHYVWKHKMLPHGRLTTTDGQEIEILNPGVHNHDAGPDFFNANIRIDGTSWMGNVEIHVNSSDWFRHHHDTDPAYDNIILHVATNVDCELLNPQGLRIPQLQVCIPETVQANYTQLIRQDTMPRCASVVSNIPSLLVHNWLSALQIERLEMRMQQIEERRKWCQFDWESTFFITLARCFGFGINGDAFERWSRAVNMSYVGKHRDNLFQVEAFFFGQAGLLDDRFLQAHPDADSQYFRRMQSEYAFLRNKFSLSPIDSSCWRFLRLRPQNFPHIRLAQLAMLYHEGGINVSKLINAQSVDELRTLLDTHVSEFWTTHYTFFSAPSPSSDKNISQASKDVIIINCVVPMLFAYGRYKLDESLCDRALELLSQVRPEKNHIITQWQSAGVRPESAADSQALIHLYKKYCEPRRCINCRFGYEYIRHNPMFLYEESEK